MYIYYLRRPNLHQVTGYLITFASCPILWSYKLQKKIILSTIDAEYIAMSQATHDLMHLQVLLQEFSTAIRLIVGDTIIQSTIFEDNNGCVELGIAPNIVLEQNKLGSNTTIFTLMSLVVKLRSSGSIKASICHCFHETFSSIYFSTPMISSPRLVALQAEGVYMYRLLQLQA